VKTQYYTASSLDGFIAGPNDSLDWLFPLGDLAETSYPKFIQDVGALTMGSATYEWMLRNVVSGPKAQPWPYGQPTWVFTSRTLPGVPGADIRFVRGDVRPVHREMAAAAGGKNVWIVGGGDLAGQFYDEGLLDELFVQVDRSPSARGSRSCLGRSPSHRSACCRCGRWGAGSRNFITRCRVPSRSDQGRFRRGQHEGRVRERGASARSRVASRPGRDCDP